MDAYARLIIMSILIETPRLILRTPTPSDGFAYVALFSNERNSQFEPRKPNPANLTVERYTRLINMWITETQEGKSAQLVVCRGEEVIGIGGVNAFMTNSETGKVTADAGVMLDSAYWRQGYASEALSALMSWIWSVVPSKGVSVSDVLAGKSVDFVQYETMAINEPFRLLVRKLGYGDGKDQENDVIYIISRPTCTDIF